MYRNGSWKGDQAHFLLRLLLLQHGQKIEEITHHKYLDCWGLGFITPHILYNICSDCTKPYFLRGNRGWNKSHFNCLFHYHTCSNLIWIQQFSFTTYTKVLKSLTLKSFHILKKFVVFHNLFKKAQFAISIYYVLYWMVKKR